MSKRDEHPTGEGEGQGGGGGASSAPHPELKHPSTKRAKQIDEPDTPYDQLVAAADEQDEVSKATGVAHWFRSKDLRIQDNVALNRASQFAQENKLPLITFYIHCAAEFEWHGTSPARTDFIRRGLESMQGELEGKGLKIPLVFVDAPERKDKVPKVLEFLKEHDISHVFANYEYEIDEVRRDHAILKEIKGTTQMSLHHDQTIMEPGSMQNESGKPQKVFTPYHKHWLSIVKDDPSLLDTVPEPEGNSDSANKKLPDKLFGSKLPAAPESKQFASSDDAKRIRKLWPAGHEAATQRLNDFLKNKVADYAATRSQPAADSTSRLSAYLASGQISIREVLSAARDANSSSSSSADTDFSESSGNAGISAWVRELVFRELYRQSIVITPHNAMNLPQNLKFEYVNWEEDEEGWKKWCAGTTGEPFVDAGMRQLAHEGWMHNRLRMVVSSYLSRNLLIDYRRGERFFAENLVDWDLCNNTQGWEPSYTVFNPVSQAERNDPDGEFIRRWVKELEGVEGKAVFAPAARLGEEEFEKLGYPRPHVDWHETKQRAVERYKNDMQGVEP